MTKGRKDDATKLRFDLLPMDVVEEVVCVLTIGCKKYSAFNWQIVPGPRRRYIAAALRHVSRWMLGEKADLESGRNHLAHALCCLLFLLWFDLHPESVVPEVTDGE